MNLEDFTIDGDTPLLHALEKIDRNEHGFLFCVDDRKKLQGVLTDGDIRRGLIDGATLESKTSDVMVKNFTYLTPQSDFEEVAEKFKSQKIKFLPITENGKLVNFLTKEQFHLLLLEDLRFDLLQDFDHLNEKTLEHEVYNRPWGFYKSTIYTDYAQAKIITVFPEGELSFQEHKKREEHWVIVKGHGKVRLDDSILDVYPGKYIFIPKGCKHQIINTSEKDNLIFTEVQLGEYFGEDDIIRYSDKYNRS